MAKKRASLGDNSPLDQLFSPKPSAPKQPASVPAKPVQPATPELKTTTIQLYPDQMEWLDTMSFMAKRGGGKASKAAIIRGMIELARAHDVDFSGVKDDEEILGRLYDALGV